MSPLPGQDLLHYRLAEEIGSGSMGVVWEATDTSLDRQVAIKVLPDELARSGDLLGRFEREAKLLASLNHPNVAAVYGVHESDGTRFLAMELVPGEDLAQRLRRGPLPLDEAIPIACRVAEALEAAHERGVVHRDIKPANVRVTPDGRVKVLDFGLAKRLQSEPGDGTADLGMTQPGVMLGTVPYMSPEQARGQPADRRSDVWAFGCVLWECLTGRRPFPGETVPDVVAAILGREPDAGDLPAATPPGVRRVLARCLEKRPERRWQHVADARLELEAAGEEEGASPPSASRSSRRPWLLAGAVVGLALVFAALGMGVGKQRGATPWVSPLADATWSQITNTGGAKHDADISPDGEWIVFVSNQNGPYEALLGQIGKGAFRSLAIAEYHHELSLSVGSVGFTGDGQGVWVCTPIIEDVVQTFPLLPGPPSTLLPAMLIQGKLEPAVAPAWSPDRSKLVYHVGTKRDPLFIADGNGANSHLLLAGPDDGYHQHFCTWSLDGAWIYVARGRPSTWEMDLWRISPEPGGPQEQVTTDKLDVRYPTPIDDRTVLYLARERSGAGPWLWALDVPTGQSHRVDPTVAQYVSLSASRDGHRILATTVRSTAALRMVEVLVDREATSGDVVPYPLPGVSALGPRIRGKDVFFLSSRGTGDGLWRHREGEDEVAEIWPGRKTPLFEPGAVSPDGQQVAVVLRQEGHHRLYVLGADGGGGRVLSDAIDVRGAADWSPDGKWLVVGGQEGGEAGLFKVRADGSGEVRRIADRHAINPVWSPDDQRIVFCGKQENAFTPLGVVSPDGEPLPLPTLLVPVEGERMRFLPDGSGLVYLKSGQGSTDFHLFDFETQAARQLTRLHETARLRTFDVVEREGGTWIVFDRIEEDSELVLIER